MKNPVFDETLVFDLPSPRIDIGLADVQLIFAALDWGSVSKRLHNVFFSTTFVGFCFWSPLPWRAKVCGFSAATMDRDSDFSTQTDHYVA